MTLNGPDPRIYAERRASLREKLDTAVLFIPPLSHAVYSNDVHYRYRPRTNLRYLSGFEEPAGLMLSNCGGDEDGFTLFVMPRDAESETWTGRRAGIEGATQDYGADQAYPQSHMFEKLRGQLANAKTLYYELSPDQQTNQTVNEVVASINKERPRTGGGPLSVVDAGALVDDMRLIKGDEEIELLRAACDASARGHLRLMEGLAPGQYEYQAEAMMEYEFRAAGCAGPAYGTIVASGSNASVLHYTANDKRLRDGDVILVDAGGEYGGYCADITRTFPVGKHYSEPQARVYDVVLDAQTAAIETVRPGVTYAQVHEAAVEVLTQGLLSLGALEGGLRECVDSEAYKPYFMHRTSHWLGMDVHDVGSYRSGEGSRVLEAGIVLTVEPGLYFRSDATVPEELRGIGVRIEDDVAVTEDGHDVLSSKVPKARAEIEKLRNGVGS